MSAILDRRCFLLSATATAMMPGSSRAAVPRPLTDTDILTLMARQIDDARICPGMLVGRIGPNEKSRILGYGRSDGANNRTLDGKTVFEIGSITKLFTAILLADMVQRGEMAMEDPVGKYLPADLHVPDFGGKPIRLVDLATYAPGLPAWPANMPAPAQGKALPAYSVEQLYAALEGQKLDYAPGTHFIYSNFAFGLLGHVLARHAGMTFEELAVARICEPLKMNDTRIVLTPSMRARLAPGHDRKLEQVPNWDLTEGIAGAGAFRSTVDDMLIFLEACMGLHKTDLSPAIAELLDVRRQADKPNMQAAAGWFVLSRFEDEIVWKDGATLGYSSFIGYSMKSRTGVVVLTNGQCGDVLTPMGAHLLNSAIPLSGI